MICDCVSTFAVSAVFVTFPNPRDVGVIAETEAAVASVGIAAAKEVPEAPYIKSLLLTLP